jgi:hypothetical protein
MFYATRGPPVGNHCIKNIGSSYSLYHLRLKYLHLATGGICVSRDSQNDNRLCLSVNSIIPLIFVTELQRVLSEAETKFLSNHF